MKNKFYKIVFILMLNVFNSMLAQQDLDFTPGANNLDPNLDKFVGTWKWEGNGKTFIWIMKKQNIQIPPYNKNVWADIIYGFHKYTDGNTVIENSLNFSNTLYDDKKTTIFGGLSSFGMNNILTGNIIHISKNRKSVNFKVEYIDPTHIKLLSLTNGEGIRFTFPGQVPFDWAITLPQDIILTKQ